MQQKQSRGAIIDTRARRPTKERQAHILRKRAQAAGKRPPQPSTHTQHTYMHSCCCSRGSAWLDTCNASCLATGLAPTVNAPHTTPGRHWVAVLQEAATCRVQSLSTQEPYKTPSCWMRHRHRHPKMLCVPSSNHSNGTMQPARASVQLQAALGCCCWLPLLLCTTSCCPQMPYGTAGTMLLATAPTGATTLLASAPTLASCGATTLLPLPLLATPASTSSLVLLL